jgi:hypothetical protein
VGQRVELVGLHPVAGGLVGAAGSGTSEMGLVAVVTVRFSSLILCGALKCSDAVVHMWCKPGLDCLLMHVKRGARYWD